jgi:AraC-like DNA-binding protein/mannose-6-phosphate isomerase-like protein (cupin superfamily)
MNRLQALLAKNTVTREGEGLSARCPVNLMLRAFKTPNGDEPPSLLDSAYSCAPYEYLVESKRTIAPHDHEHYEIVFVLGGRALHCTPHYEALLERGDVLVVAPGQVHGLREIDGLHRASCVYLPEWLVRDSEELRAEAGVLGLFLSRSTLMGAANQWIVHHKMREEEFASCFQELRCIVRELGRERMSVSYLKHCLIKLLIVVGRSVAASEGSPHEVALRQEVLEALAWIEQAASSAQPFDLPTLAHRCGLSTSYFSGLFRKATGISPSRYFQQQRIQHACWLLLHTQHPITDIACSLGFTDASHFVRVFHKLRGSSPRAYRERYVHGEAV